MILKFEHKKPINSASEPDEIFANDDLNGALAGAPENKDVDLYVRWEASGDISFLYSQTHGETTEYAYIEMTPEQARSLGRALLGKFD